MCQMESQQIKIDFNPTIKQDQAWNILHDNETNVLYYGGAASGGKTYLACAWLIINCLQYPGSRWFIGRDKLNTILKSTINTFRDICKSWDLIEGEAWKLNTINGTIKFYNGSEVYLLDLHHNPADENFDRLGSMEFTGGFLEEVAEVSRKGYEIIGSRIRYKLKDFNLIPKMLIVSNPTKNWVYTDFYVPWKNNNLRRSKKFLQALPTDNPHTSEHYLNSLKNLNEVDKQRLLFGNFDYDDDDRALCQFNKLLDCFSNTFVEGGNAYIVADLAMQGRDKFIVSVWDGLRVHFEIIKPKAKGKEIEWDLRDVAEKYHIPRSNIIVDSDGMGNYLESYMEGIVEFHGGNSADNTEEFKNLKSECAFKLAELINSNQLYVDCTDEVKNVLLEELGQLKRDNLDKDEMKKHIIKKEEMKDNIGRSPDFLDCLIMRMLPEIKPQPGLSF